MEVTAASFGYVLDWQEQYHSEAEMLIGEYDLAIIFCKYLYDEPSLRDRKKQSLTLDQVNCSSGPILVFHRGQLA